MEIRPDQIHPISTRISEASMEELSAIAEEWRCSVEFLLGWIVEEHVRREKERRQLKKLINW